MADSFNELMGLGTHSEDASLEVWHPCLDDAASTTVVDESSNSRNATLVGGDNTADISATGPNGWLSKGLDLDGTADRIDLSSAVAVTGSAERTYSVFLKPGAFSTGFDEPIMAFQSDSTTGRRLQMYAEDNAISVGFNGHRVITPKATLSTGTWYHFSVRVPAGASTTADADILIDGVNQTLSTEGGTSRTLNTAAPSSPCPCVGHDPGASGAPYGNHVAAHITSFSRALTDAEHGQLCSGPEPINNVAPVMSGTETVEQTLSCTTGTWALDSPFAGGTNGTITYTYQWTRSDDSGGTNEADISGAISSTYTLQSADSGKHVRCRVRGTNDGGFDSAEDTVSNMSGAIAGGGGQSVVPIIHQQVAAYV